MKVITIVGARPQFVKAAVVSREISQHKGINEIIIHTGQHFDDNMSRIFFDQMQIPEPDYNLGINSMQHGAMTGKMLTEIEKVILDEKPDWVLVYGDTNSTLAGALAAAKQNIKVAHVEAGLRSFNQKMPEEINRILTDKVADLLLCPTSTAVKNLGTEGIRSGGLAKVVNSGDVMYDAALFYSELSMKPQFEVPEEFILSTIHRAENTDEPDRLNSIISALNEINEETEILVPLHPRTRKKLISSKIQANFRIVDPIGYLEMIYLLKRCKMVMTDSGGLQKEAFFFDKPCITLRDETEWVELIDNGYNVLAGADFNKILDSYRIMKDQNMDFSEELYGDGYAAKKIIRELLI
jgi:UDP-GlcNAc3NAcA epimerase